MEIILPAPEALRIALNEAMTFGQLWQGTRDFAPTRLHNAKFVKAYQPRALIIRDDSIVCRFCYISQPSTEGKAHYGYVQFFPNKDFVKKNGKMQDVISVFRKGGTGRKELRLYGKQIPFQKVRAVDLNSMFCKVSCDCFAGDTKVSLLDGREVEIRDLVGTSGNWGYSCVEGSNGEIIPNRILKVWERGVKKLVKVTLDNGESIKCTPDHLFMLRDGTYAAASTLTGGTSLMPLYRRLSEKVLMGYEMVFFQSRGWKYTHRLVANHCNPQGAGKGKHVHHASFDKRNNNPESLVWMDSKEHAKIHRDHGVYMAAKNNANPSDALKAARRENGKKLAERYLSNSEHRAKVKASLRKTWDDPETREVRVKSMKGRLRSEETKKKMSEGYSDERRAIARANAIRMNNAPDAHLKRLASWTPERRKAASDRAKARHARKLENAPNNHKVVSVEDCGEEMTYDMMMEGVPNFALSAGVFVHNCKDFLYRCEVALHHHGASDIKFSNGEDPVKTNPNKSPFLCKHLLSAIQYLVNGSSLDVDMDLPNGMKVDPYKPATPEVTTPPAPKPEDKPEEAPRLRQPDGSVPPKPVEPEPEFRAPVVPAAKPPTSEGPVDENEDDILDEFGLPKEG